MLAEGLAMVHRDDHDRSVAPLRGEREAQQSVELRVYDGGVLIETLSKLTVNGDQQKASWPVPNTFAVKDLVFEAILRDKPSPKNGHVTSRGKVRSAKLAVHGFNVAIRSTDASLW